MPWALCCGAAPWRSEGCIGAGVRWRRANSAPGGGVPPAMRKRLNHRHDRPGFPRPASCKLGWRSVDPTLLHPIDLTIAGESVGVRLSDLGYLAQQVRDAAVMVTRRKRLPFLVLAACRR